MFERIARWIRGAFPEIDCDAGSVVHFVYGFLGPVLGFLVDNMPFVVGLFSVLFVLKQLLDVYGGEVPKITGGDIAEYCGGVVAGLVTVILLTA